ncbi:MAG: peroxiredoxin family protein [Xanthobacteraceae bacterium]
MSLRDALADLYSKFDSDQLQARHAAAARIIADEEKRRARQVGDRAPAFSLNDPDFGIVSSSEVLQHGALVVNFYRGLWCSYCQRDLLGLESAAPDLRNANASIAAITHGLEKEVRERLRRSANLSFPILDDIDGNVAEQFGIRWRTEEANLIETELGDESSYAARRRPMDRAYAGSLRHRPKWRDCLRKEL